MAKVRALTKAAVAGAAVVAVGGAGVAIAATGGGTSQFTVVNGKIRAATGTPKPASGTEAVLYSNRSVATTTISGSGRVVLSAIGENCAGWPTVRVSIDGAVVGETRFVSDTKYGNYPVGGDSEAARVPDGRHVVKIAFIDDEYRPGRCDRNVALAGARMENPSDPPDPTPTGPTAGPSSPAPTPTATPTATPTSAPTGPPASGKPNASNTGVPPGTTLSTYNGPLTITTDGTVIDGKHVYGDIKVAARNVVIRNSYLHGGTGIPGSNTGVVDANSANVFNLLLERNTIIPDHPSYYRDGVVGHEYTARGNHVTRSNDGFGIFNKPGLNTKANVTLERNYVHDLTRWNNDPAHSDGTHNDGIQVQGGENIRIVGNNVVGSVVPGDGLGRMGRHGGAAILLQQNTARLANVVVERNWFDDAQNSVCVQHGSYPEVTVTVQNNFLGRNQYDFGNGSKYPIRVYSKSKDHVIGLYTNRWEDTNELLREGRDLGIRFNGP